MEILRGELYYVDLEPTKEHEMKKSHRPCLIVSSNSINKTAPIVIVFPITDSYNKFSPIHIKVPKGDGGLTKESVVHCGQVRAIDQLRIGSKLGKLDKKIMKDVDTGLRHSLEL